MQLHLLPTKLFLQPSQAGPVYEKLQRQMQSPAQWKCGGKIKHANPLSLLIFSFFFNSTTNTEIIYHTYF